MCPSESLNRTVLRAAREIESVDSRKTIATYDDVSVDYDPNPVPRVVFENARGESVELYADGSLCACASGVRVPMLAVYVGAHALMNARGAAMPRGCHVDTALPGGVDRDAFWRGDASWRDLAGECMDASDVEDPFEPGVLEPGRVVPFSSAIDEILGDESRFPTNSRMPIAFVRTPVGRHATRDVFEIDDADAIEFFSRLLSIVERRSKKKKRRGETYAIARPANQIRVKNGNVTADGYLLYATMDDASFDEALGTFDLTWTAIAA